LLRRGLQSSVFLGFAAQSMDGRHQFLRLINKSLAKINGPGEIVVHHLDHGGEFRHLFDIIVPGLRIQFRQVVGVADKASGLDNFQWIGGCGQHHRQNWIRMERNPLNHFLQFSRARFGRRGWRRGCGSRFV
jgi:hypothetical protein